MFAVDRRLALLFGFVAALGGCGDDLPNFSSNDLSAASDDLSSTVDLSAALGPDIGSLPTPGPTCRTASDCGGDAGTVCYAPGETADCYAQVTPCNDDSQCGPGEVCDVPPTCVAMRVLPQRRCIPRCNSNTDCPPPSISCNLIGNFPRNHCSYCPINSQCPVGAQCGGTYRTCICPYPGNIDDCKYEGVKQCSSDSDCNSPAFGGYCVNGQCYDWLGSCTPPSANCAFLDEATCKSTPGCRPNYCPCGNYSGYGGCFSYATTASCPSCPSICKSSEDCLRLALCCFTASTSTCEQCPLFDLSTAPYDFSGVD